MHVAIVIRHPEHARFYSPIHDRLVDAGHEVSVFVRDTDHATDVLTDNGIDHEVLAGEAHSQLDLVVGHATFEARLLRAARRRTVDVLTSIGGLAVEHVAPLVGARSVVFVDWERGGVADASVVRLADVVCVPAFVRSTFGNRSVTYRGYHELAYLHPSRFEPSAERLTAYGVDPSTPYAVLGFVGDDPEVERAAASVARALEDRGELYFTHESILPPGFESGQRLSHAVTEDAIAFADLCVGTSGTMAAEAAVLGTPSVFLARGETRDPRCASLADRYGLIVELSDSSDLVPAVERLLAEPDATAESWRTGRDRLLAETEDVVGVATDLLVGGTPRKTARQSVAPSR